MSRNDDDKDFGRVLEDFEHEKEGGVGQKRPRGKLIRQHAEPPEQKQRSYQRPEEVEDFAAALADFDAERGDGAERLPRAGETVEGTLISLDLESALVDFGAKAEGIIATDELVDADGILLFKVGERVTLKVVGPDPAGALRLRRPGSSSDEQIEVGVQVQGEITAINKGGAEVRIGARQQGFCPFSQLADRRVEDAETMVGQRLVFEVTKSERGNLVLSRRVLLEREKRERAEQLRSQLHVGGVVSGQVTAIEDYGVFVDLGGLEGMVHISELSHQRLEHPRDLISPGQELEVKITRLEHRPDGRDRISLSRKALDPDPWVDANQGFKEGTTAEGKVRRLESFGAFVELAPGVEGLVHISELGGGRHINHPREVLELGQKLAVRVLRLEADKKRISLAPIHDAELEAAEPSVRQMLDEHRGAADGFGSLAAAFKKNREK